VTADPAPDKPLRVAFCHYTADVCGGSDRSLFDLATHLPRDRFCAAMILDGADPMVEAYRAAGLEVVPVRFVGPRRAPELRKQLRFLLSYWPSVVQVARAIRQLRAEVVHVNTINNLQGPVAAWLARRPLVWHIRELGKGTLIDKAMIGLVRRLATRVVAVSRAVGDTLVSCGDRLRIIPNGVDVSDYDCPANGGAFREELGLADDQPLVTTVGRLEYWKGQHVLVEAVPAVLEAFPAARFAIVGGAAVNKPEYGPGLQARCRELGVADNVVFTGPRNDIPIILNVSDVLVLPTCTAEPFGRTVVEAMAAGCPVVATAAGGPLETVLNGETGWLVPPDDAGALAERVRHVLAHPDEARRMGEAGRRRARECYSLERLVRDMAALFEEVAAGQAPGESKGDTADGVAAQQ